MKVKLTKKPTVLQHDELHQQMCIYLNQNTDFRAPGVCENLFRLSDYISGKKSVPDKPTLTFLHAYIFALEQVTYSMGKEMRRLKSLLAKYEIFGRPVSHRRPLPASPPAPPKRRIPPQVRAHAQGRRT